jgi:hypothetical protein
METSLPAGPRPASGGDPVNYETSEALQWLE